MLVSDICKSYFNGFYELSETFTNDTKTEILAMVKVISYITIIIPSIFGIVYAIASLVGRVSIKDSPSSQDNRMKLVAASTLPSPVTKSKVDNSEDEDARIRKETLVLLQPIKLFDTTREALINLAILNKGFKNLQKLDLNNIDPEDLEDLSILAKKMLNPRILILGSRDFQSLRFISSTGLKNLSSCKSIKTLIADGTRINYNDPQAIKALYEFARTTQIENLRMNFLQTVPEKRSSFSAVNDIFLRELATNRHLQRLSFNSNAITTLALDALGNSTLTSLSLRRCFKSYQVIDDQDIIHLLKNNSNLTCLELENLRITNEGCKCIQQHSALSDVSLDSAKGLTDDGVKILLTNNHKLKSLSISYNSESYDLSYDFAILNGSFMPFVLTSSLEKFDISYTDFTEDNLIQLAKSSTITYLRATNTIWSSEVIKAFKKNTSLTCLYPGDEALSKKQRMLGEIIKPRELLIPENSIPSCRNYSLGKRYKIELNMEVTLLRNQRLLHNWRLLVVFMALTRAVRNDNPLWPIRDSAISIAKDMLSPIFREILPF